MKGINNTSILISEFCGLIMTTAVSSTLLRNIRISKAMHDQQEKLTWRGKEGFVITYSDLSSP
jgi:hypothetical protein